jgi:hypothetical protein
LRDSKEAESLTCQTSFPESRRGFPAPTFSDPAGTSGFVSLVIELVEVSFGILNKALQLFKSLAHDDPPCTVTLIVVSEINGAARGKSSFAALNLTFRHARVKQRLPSSRILGRFWA